MAIWICSRRTRKATPTASIARTSGQFEDVAVALGVAGTPRPKEDGGVGPSVADFDRDGDFDLFVANYGHSALYRNDGGLTFTEVSRERGIDLNGHGVTSGWGDLDNDGLPDLYVANFIAGQPLYRDALFINGAKAFVEVVAGRDPEARCDARRAVRRLRSRRPARSGADQQRSRWRRPPAAAQHRGDAWAIDRHRSHGSQCAPHARRQRSAGLSIGHAATAVVGARRFRQRLLLAERHARAPGNRRRLERPRRYRGDHTSSADAASASIVRDVNPDDYRGRSLRIITTR